MHYYQPLWTLVGAGIKSLSDSEKTMHSVMPPKAHWIKASVTQFDPDNNKIKLSDGSEVSYDYLVVAIGLKIDWDKVKGLEKALETPHVCSNYSKTTVLKTKPALDLFKQGNAIFTFPNTVIKCAGAPQKIMYLADAHFRKVNLIINILNE